MEIEYSLYIQESISEPKLLEQLRKNGVFYHLFNSSKHHPRAILLHRTQYSKKIVSSEYQLNSTKVALIYLTSLSSESELDQLSEFFPVYTQNNIKILLVIQGGSDLMETFKFSSLHHLPKEYYENWLIKSMIQGVDCIETDSYKDSANTIYKILKILTNSPYKLEASIYRMHSKKLQINTEIASEKKEWALQLVNISGISEAKACKIISKFPTLSSLIRYYQDESISQEEKRILFTKISERKEKRLSEKMFTVYNSINPNEIV